MKQDSCAYCKHKRIGDDYPDVGGKRKWSSKCGLHNFDIGCDDNQYTHICDDYTETRVDKKKLNCNYRVIK